jgi:hypothetical protein
MNGKQGQWVVQNITQKKIIEVTFNLIRPYILRTFSVLGLLAFLVPWI